MRLFCVINQQSLELDNCSPYAAELITDSGINKKTAKLPTITEEELCDLPNTVIVADKKQARLSQSKRAIYVSDFRPIEALHIFYRTSLKAINYLSQNDKASFSFYKKTFKDFIQDIHSFEANLHLLINELDDIFNGVSCMFNGCGFFCSTSQKLKKPQTITDQFINAFISINSFSSHEEAIQYQHVVDTLICTGLRKYPLVTSID